MTLGQPARVTLTRGVRVAVAAPPSNRRSRTRTGVTTGRRSRTRRVTMVVVFVIGSAADVVGCCEPATRWAVRGPEDSAQVRRGASEGEPVPFQVYEPGVFLHGTRADLAVGAMLVPGRESNFEVGRVMTYVYFTATLDAAAWGAELAAGQGRERIYLVEPTGAFEDDPNLTDKKFPGNPTHSFRSREPLRVVGELDEWVGHPPEKLQAMRDGLDALKRQGPAHIED